MSDGRSIGHEVVQSTPYEVKKVNKALLVLSFSPIEE